MQLVKRAETGDDQAQAGGLAGRLLAAFARVGSNHGWKGRVAGSRKKLHLMETLSLGGRKQLILVNCAGEHYLIGTGPDSVSSMIHVAFATQAETGHGSTRPAEPQA